jgi:hypothetical protein
MNKKKVGSALLVLFLGLSMIGWAEAPAPIPSVIVPSLFLDVSQATFTLGPTGSGTWFIPVFNLQAVFKALPTQEVAIGLMVAGPDLAVVRVSAVQGLVHFSFVPLVTSAEQIVTWQGNRLTEACVSGSGTNIASAEGTLVAATTKAATSGAFPIYSPTEPSVLKGKVDVDFEGFGIKVHIHIQWGK